MKTKLLLFIAIAAVGLASCTKDIVEPKVVVITPNASAQFSTDIYPIFTNYSCTTCHGSSGGLTLTGTASVVRGNLISSGAVVPNSSATSLLFIKFNNGGTHNGKTMTSTEISNIKGWIDSGALDN